MSRRIMGPSDKKSAGRWPGGASQSYCRAAARSFARPAGRRIPPVHAGRHVATAPAPWQGSCCPFRVMSPTARRALVALVLAILVFAAGALVAMPVPLALGGVGRVMPGAAGALPALALDLAAPPPEA